MSFLLPEWLRSWAASSAIRVNSANGRVRYAIALLEPRLELSLGMFDCTVIGGIIRRAVERYDTLVSQEFLDGRAGLKKLDSVISTVRAPKDDQ